MILTVASALISLGFVTWILGSIFEYHGVATIGAVVIVGVGAMVANGGLEFKTGEIETTVDNSTTETENQYNSVDTPTHLSLGAIIMLLGGTLFLRALNELGGGS